MRAGGIRGKSLFDGRGRGLNDEELLLDRVVEIAGQPRAFLLPGSLTDRLLVASGDPRLVAQDNRSVGPDTRCRRGARARYSITTPATIGTAARAGGTTRMIGQAAPSGTSRQTAP
jgi:hypothetical protein